jgi:2-methylisocitrate lyase-like PEP mutase family enzyme
MTAPTTTLKEIFSRPNSCTEVGMPINALHAMFLEKVGYEAFFLGAGAVMGQILGRPDNGTITMTEAALIASWFTQATSVPCIVDVDACYGGIFQVQRAVREYIKAGVAGIQMEDQPFLGKRMGAFAGKEVVPVEEMVAKIRVAVDTRNQYSPDFQISARCDALTAVNGGGLPDTIKRLLAYKAAGADVLHFEGPRTFDEIRQVRAEVPGPLTVTPYSLPGSQDITAQEGRELGLAAVYYLKAQRANHRFMWAYWERVKQNGPRAAYEEFCENYPADEELIRVTRRYGFDFAKIEEIERQYYGDEVDQKYAAEINRELPRV